MEAEELRDSKQEITILLQQVKKSEEEHSELYENFLKIGK